MVPLGSAVVSGVVVKIFGSQIPPSLQKQFHQKPLRSILSVETQGNHSPLDANLLTLVEKISQYYLTSLAACLRLVVPPHSEKMNRRVLLTDTGRLALSNSDLSWDVQLVLRKLEQAPKGLLRSSLTRSLKNVPAILTRGKKKGWITERTTLPIESRTSPPVSARSRANIRLISVSPGLFDRYEEKKIDLPGSVPQEILHASEECRTWEQLSSAMQAGSFQEVPVVGPDAYQRNLLIQSIKAMGQKGRRVVILTPKVHQAETLGQQLGIIVKGQVEVYHGHLSSRTRSARWERIRQGDVQVVVGTRSALFLPIPDLGLIWISQEENFSYKDEHLPYYHAREVARMRGECEEILVVYSSMSPSLEMYGRFRSRVSEALEHVWQAIPRVEMIDMRSLPYDTVVSPVLFARMTRAVEAKEQIILFLNRKGFSGALICRDCGMAPLCSTCGVSLKLYRQPSRLVCGYCEKSREMPETCPTCHGTLFRFSGMGTQRVEEEVLRVFPSVSVARFDRENVNTDKAAAGLLRDFQQRDIQILIGTELLFHQSPQPAANVVGLLHAELGLHIPDFRSAERTFQMLSNVLHLAKNEQEPAEVILQTRLPTHHVLQAIEHHHPCIFYDQELALREALGYPPATHLILVVIMGVQTSRVQKVVEFLRQRLRGMERKGTDLENEKRIFETPMILGPVASRKSGHLKKHRVLFLIKTGELSKIQQYFREIQREYELEFSKEPVVFEVNVDPVDIQ